MRRRSLTICAACGGDRPSGTADFVVFHCLTFCSPDCLGDYRAADDERCAKKDAARRDEPVKTRGRRAA